MSLHQRILTDIQNLIVSGEWPPGRKIPVEHEFMKQYKCSRMTVSKVLTQLANARMIERRRKLGSFVSRPHSQSAVLTIPDIKAEVAALGQPYTFEVLRRTRRRSTREDKTQLGTEKTIPVLELVCLHMAGTQPFCFEQRLINLEAVPQVAKESFTEMPPGTWLLHSVPWTLAEHRIRAAEASGETATALKVRPKSPVLTIERTTRSAESTTITFVRLAYPGELHELVASFAPPTVTRQGSDTDPI
jgi:GntR family histidine utilization transcriptional repressor